MVVWKKQDSIKITRLEYELLKYLKNKGFNFIARDNWTSFVHAYRKKPFRDHNIWCESNGFTVLNSFNDCFQFIKWEDEEPYEIQNILNRYVIVDND